MINKFLLAVIFSAVIFNCTNKLQPAGDNSKEEWIELFNGKDLSDWNVKINHHETGENYSNTFRAEDGMIKVRYDQYGAFDEQFGHLYFKTPFSCYKLFVEYRFTGEFKNDAPDYAILNSGVMFHSQDPHSMPKDQNWPISIEFQFNAGLGDGKPRPTGSMCSPGTNVVFNGKLDERHCIPSSSKTFEKNEWIKAELVVYSDSLVYHIINGDTVLQYSKPQIGGNVVKNFDPKIKIDGKLLNEGFIALQSEGQPIDFKNVKLLKLNDCVKRN